MKSKLIHTGDEKTYALIFETGDEALSELQKFAQEYRLGASRLSGIGAFSDVRLGFFDWRTKDYRPIPLDEQVEVLSFVGDIALENNEPKVHGTSCRRQSGRKCLGRASYARSCSAHSGNNGYRISKTSPAPA